MCLGIMLLLPYVGGEKVQRRITLLFILLLTATTVLTTVGQISAQSQPNLDAQAETKKSAQQRRAEAKARLEAMLEGRQPQEAYELAVKTAQATVAAPMAATVQPPTGINPAVDVNLPNFAYSPNIRKFVNSLPGLAINPAPGDWSVNNLGQYIPVAIPDTLSYPGSDYYEIGLVEYTEQMNSDLPPTKLRGYVQLNGGDPVPHYLARIMHEG